MNRENILKEIQALYPPCRGIRCEKGNVEFALDSTYGDQWFPYYILPKKASDYVHCLIKTGAFNAS